MNNNDTNFNNLGNVGSQPVNNANGMANPAPGVNPGMVNPEANVGSQPINNVSGMANLTPGVNPGMVNPESNVGSQPVNTVNGMANPAPEVNPGMVNPESNVGSQPVNTVNGMTNSAQGVNTSASNVENQTVFPPVNDISNMMGTNQTEGSPPLTQAQLGSDVNVVPKRKSKSKKIFLSTVIVIILLVAGYISWNLFVTFTPLQLFTKAIDTLQGTINEFYSYGSVSGNVNINFDSDANENYNLFATYASDFKDKILTSSFDFKYENTDVIKGNVYYLDNKLYVEAKELYSQVPYFESDADFSVTIDNYVANYKVLCQEYLEAFKASMRDDMISYKKSNDLDVYTFVIDDSNYLEFWTSVFNYLKSDQKFIDAYQSIFVDDNAIDFLDGCIDDLSFDKKKMTISLYLKSRSLSQISITSNMNEYDIMELNLTDIKGSNFNYTIKYGDDYVFNGSFARNDNTDVFKLAFKIDYNGSVELEIVNNYNVEVVAPKIENAINYENISDEDKQIIYQRAQELILDL